MNRSPKFKSGDVVIYEYGPYKYFGLTLKYSELTNKNYYWTVENGPHSGDCRYPEHNMRLDEIYYSPLSQALKETND